MTRLMLILTVIALFLNSCNGQKKQTKDEQEKQKSKPQTEVIVNKEYDDEGNLIRYDSTYSYYYSNIENDSMLEDSIFNDFRTYFNHTYPFANQPFFNDFFFQDSLLHYDFYKDDFFQHRYKKDMEQMNKLFWIMDSLKNQFFREQTENFKEEQ